MEKVTMIETFVCVLVVALYLIISLFTADNKSSDDNSQLEQMNDGMGNIIVDGEHMSRTEAEDAQARGEL
jgi:hypothetical protein